VNPGVVIVVVGLALLAGSWRVARHRRRRTPPPRWEPTEEVFTDPETNRMMRVWVDPVDGSRHDVPAKGMR
jgi:hypothetical protein